MALDYYLPDSYSDRVLWAFNFKEAFKTRYSKYGYTSTDVTNLENDYLAIKYGLDMQQLVKALSKSFTTFKQDVFKGTPGPNPVIPPDFSGITTLATPVKAGVISRITQMVEHIRTHVNYDLEDGKAFGIIGPEVIPDYENMQPDPKLVEDADNHNIISFTKGLAEGVIVYRYIYKQGEKIDPSKEISWGSPIAKVNHSPYIDINTNADLKPEVRLYKLVYFVKDKMVGKESQILRVLTHIYLNQDGSELIAIPK